MLFFGGGGKKGEMCIYFLRGGWNVCFCLTHGAPHFMGQGRGIIRSFSAGMENNWELVLLGGGEGRWGIMCFGFGEMGNICFAGEGAGIFFVGGNTYCFWVGDGGIKGILCGCMGVICIRAWFILDS